MGKIVKKWLVVLLVISCIQLNYLTKPISADVNEEYKTYVMAPLTKVTNWSEFSKQLETLKNNGVYGITTDIWWGDVEGAGDNQFDWSYYKQYAQIVKDSGLMWTPIISTHQCGGNVGDDCNVPIPNWLWGLAPENHLAQKSETGYINKETLSPWASDVIEEQYNELYQSFAENFSEYKDIISKIYVSTGAAGELRYSSYAATAGWSYPERGEFQAYSTTAMNDFRNEMQEKYGDFTSLNNAWGTNISSWNQVTPPTDGDHFFTSGAAYESEYGKDFLNWYQSKLVYHLELVGRLAHENFDSTFNVPIGAKIAGIHWKRNDPIMPNAAEYSAGYYAYETILDQFKASNLELTFTALEMDDGDANVHPYYSSPKSLVSYIAEIASNKDLVINGENALAISSSDAQYSNGRYKNIAQHLFNEDFHGFTLLRLKNLVHADGSKTAEMDRFKDIVVLQPVKIEFIVKNAPTAYGDTVYITGNRWEMGMWNDTDGKMIELTWDGNNNDWRGIGYIAAERDYEFKAVIKDVNGNVKAWEPGGNHQWNTPNHESDYLIDW